MDILKECFFDQKKWSKFKTKNLGKFKEKAN